MKLLVGRGDGQGLAIHMCGDVALGLDRGDLADTAREGRRWRASVFKVPVQEFVYSWWTRKISESVLDRCLLACERSGVGISFHRFFEFAAMWIPLE